MEILNFLVHFDGGTIEIVTNEGSYCFDGRTKSKTKGRLYYGYPKKDNSNLIENYIELEVDIVNALEEYNNKIGFDTDQINYYLKNKQNKNK
jgi:hypothetical protein